MRASSSSTSAPPRPTARIGPIETYEDELFGYKAAHEAVILLKDKDGNVRAEAFDEEEA